MVYIPTKEPPISSETTLVNAKQWLNIIRYGEYGTVIQLQDDCEYRVQDIIDNPKILKSTLGPYYRKYLLKYVPVDHKDLKESIKETLIALTKERKIKIDKDISSLSILEIVKQIASKGFEIGLFISRISHLLDEPEHKSLIELEYLLEHCKNFSVIVFFEKDITHDQYKLLTDKCSLIFDNVYKYPLYEQKNSLQFIKYHEEMWQLKLTPSGEDEIVRLCGGYLWLISHLMRYFRDNPHGKIENAITNEMLLRKLESIWFKFTDAEKRIFYKVANKSLEDEDRLTQEYKYLSAIRIIIGENGKTALGLPLLNLVIEKEQDLNELQFKDGIIYAKGIDIAGQLTPYENRFLQELLKNQRKIISRDQVARMLWENKWEDKYSDWAIDRLAYRLRQKIKTLGINDKFIKTVKRKGFIYNYL